MKPSLNVAFLLCEAEGFFSTPIKILDEYYIKAMHNARIILLVDLFGLTGKTESEVKEVDKVMYHDWRLIPKQMEQQFRDFEPLPEPPVRYVFYPPLLRAMILAEHKKTYGAAMAEEPLLPLQRDVLLNKDYFQKQERERQRAKGTPV